MLALAHSLRNPRVGLRMASHLAVHVKATVNPSSELPFFALASQASRSLLLQPGVLRYDILRNNEDKQKFLMIKVFKDVSDLDAHKTTSFYTDYTREAEPLMQEPRQTARYNTLFPTQSSGWDSRAAVQPSTSATPASTASSTAATLEADGANGMFAVCVDIAVIPEHIEAFIAATLANCKASLLEPGVTRFDFLQHQKDPNNFVLVEVYNSPTGPALHKETPHYATWAKTVASMMARPRAATKYTTLFPSRLHWHQTASYSHPGTRGLAEAPSNFGFASPKLLMGRGIAGTAIKNALADLNIKRPFIVTGTSGFLRFAELFTQALGSADPSSTGIPHYCIKGEPTTEDAQKAVQIALQHQCDGVLAVGGGSAIDLGKAVSALVTNKDDIFEYIEVVGRGTPIKALPVPFIAVPTTSGTGSEMTKNAVLKSLVHGVKASIRHDTMLPR